MLKNTDIICVEIQCPKKEYKSRVKKIEQILDKKFRLLYKKNFYRIYPYWNRFL